MQHKVTLETHISKSIRYFLKILTLMLLVFNALFEYQYEKKLNLRQKFAPKIMLQV